MTTEPFIQGAFCKPLAGRNFAASDAAKERVFLRTATGQAAVFDTAVKAERAVFGDGPWSGLGSHAEMKQVIRFDHHADLGWYLPSREVSQ